MLKLSYPVEFTILFISVLTYYCRFDGFYRRTEGSMWQCLGCPASFQTSRGMRRHLGIFRWRDRDIEISQSGCLQLRPGREEV